MKTDQKLAKNLDGIAPKIYARRWWILLALLFALLGVILANGSMNMALPSMAKDMNLTTLDLTWMVNIYTLAFASLLFISGAIGDRYGRRKIMQFGLMAFILATFYAAIFAKSLPELIIARLIMGVGGACVMPTTLSIINNVFPKKERPRAVALWGMVAGIGMMFGSVISGLLLNNFTWHSLFYFSGILGIVGLIFNVLVVPESRDEKQNPIDFVGGILSAAAIFGLVYGVTEWPASGFGAANVWGSVLAGIFAVILFAIWEHFAKSPILDMRLFKNRSFTVASLALILIFFGFVGTMFSISQVMQLVLGLSPLKTALLMIPIMLPMSLSAVTASLVKKIGARLTIGIGMALAAIGFFMMSRLGGNVVYWQVFATMIVLISGVAISMTPATNILMDAVPRNRSGMGSAMNDVTRQFGGALGVAILGSILSAVYQEKVASATEKFVAAISSPTNATNATANFAQFSDNSAANIANLTDGISNSLAPALQISEKFADQAAHLPSFIGEKIINSANDLAVAAKSAFMSGISESALISAAIFLITGILVYSLLPKHHKGDTSI